MRKGIVPFAVWALCLSLPFTIPVARAQDDSGAPSSGGHSTENVQVTFRLGAIENGKKVPVKVYDLVVASGSMGSKLLSGTRVPIPMSAEDRDGDDDPEFSFVYQNIGFHTEMRAWIMDGKKIMLMGDIEDSTVRESKSPGNPPIVETRQLTINAVLTEGVPLELTRVQGVADLEGYVEVEAKIID